MKRYGNLWHKIIDIENIKHAHQQARRGKAFYSEVKMVDADVDKYALEIQQMLINNTFTTSPYEIESRFDGRKMREIYKLPYYPDRIVQHALLNVVGELLTNTLIRDTFQSIKGRGTHDAARRVKGVIRSEDCPKYALKIDIKKYYPSVNNDLLKQMVRKKIKCPETLRLIDDVINSTKGLPIGNYTSQIFGNLYLNEFDWMVKQKIKPKGYFRYCDDIVVLANTVPDLLSVKIIMVKALNKLGLGIKPSWIISDIKKDGLDFVGFLFRPHYTKLRKSIVKNFKANCKNPKNLNSLMAYKGWVRCCNAKNLWRKHTEVIRHVYPIQLRKPL